MTHLPWSIVPVVSLGVVAVVVRWMLLQLLILYLFFVPQCLYGLSSHLGVGLSSPPLVFWHNLSYSLNVSLIQFYPLHSLILCRNYWHFSNNSCPILTFSSFIHVLIRLLHMYMVLFVCLTLSSISCFSALCMILIPLSVLMFLFNLKLTGVIFWLRHLRVNLL